MVEGVKQRYSSIQSVEGPLSVKGGCVKGVANTSSPCRGQNPKIGKRGFRLKKLPFPSAPENDNGDFLTQRALFWAVGTLSFVSLVFLMSLANLKQGISLVILVFSLSFLRILWAPENPW